MSAEHGPAMPFTFHQTRAAAARSAAPTTNHPPSTAADKARVLRDTLAGKMPEQVDAACRPSRPVDDLDGMMRYALAVPYLRHARNTDALWYAPASFGHQLARGATGEGFSMLSVPLTVNHDDADEVGQVLGAMEAPDDLGLIAFFQLYKDAPASIRTAADEGCPCSIGALPLTTRSGPYMSREVTVAHMTHLSLCVGYYMGGAFREAVTDTSVDGLLRRVRATTPGPGPAETFDERMGVNQ